MLGCSPPWRRTCQLTPRMQAATWPPLNCNRSEQRGRRTNQTSYNKTQNTTVLHHAQCQFNTQKWGGRQPSDARGIPNLKKAPVAPKDPHHDLQRVHAYAYMHACIYAYTHRYRCMHTCVHTYVYECLHAHTYAIIYVYIHIRMCIYITM